MSDEVVTYDPDALPNSVEVEQLQQTRALSEQIAALNGHVAQLGAQSDEGASDVGTVVVMDDSQYQAIEYDLRCNNTITIMLLVLMGICVGLNAWHVLSSRWL